VSKVSNFYVVLRVEEASWESCTVKGQHCLIFEKLKHFPAPLAGMDERRMVDRQSETFLNEVNRPKPQTLE